MNTADHQSGNSTEIGRRPALGEPVWVKWNGFRCLACLGVKGRWKTFFDGKELSGVVKVLPDQFHKVDVIQSGSVHCGGGL